MMPSVTLVTLLLLFLELWLSVHGAVPLIDSQEASYLGLGCSKKLACEKKQPKKLPSKARSEGTSDVFSLSPPTANLSQEESATGGRDFCHPTNFQVFFSPIASNMTVYVVGAPDVARDALKEMESRWKSKMYEGRTRKTEGPPKELEESRESSRLDGDRKRAIEIIFGSTGTNSSTEKTTKLPRNVKPLLWTTTPLDELVGRRRRKRRARRWKTHRPLKPIHLSSQNKYNPSSAPNTVATALETGQLSDEEEEQTQSSA